MENKDRLTNQQAQSMEQDKGQLYLSLSGQLSPYSVPSLNAHDLHMEIQVEIEKEKIREEIIISEIARRVMKAEVMRGLMLSAPAIGGHGLPLSFWPSPLTELVSPMRLSHLGERADQTHMSSFEERVRMLMGGAKKERHEGVGFEAPHFQGRTSGLRIHEVEPVCQEKGKKLILLDKPDENISRSKRKTVSPPPQVDDSDFSSRGISNKRAKGDWSCSVCHISCTGQRALDDHLQGRKHKVREAALKVNKAGGNYCIGLF